MPIWEWLLDSAGRPAVPAAALRRRCSSSAVGGSPATAAPSSSASASGPAGAGRGWLLGLGRYTGDHLEWFRIFSLSPRPRVTYSRAATSTYVGRRDPEGVEAYSLYAGHVVVICRTPAGPLELAMSPAR